jgi:hypothetical protein
MLSCRAISDGTPAARSCFTFSALARAVGALPLYLPSALALAMPTSMRFLINSRSNWAIAPPNPPSARQDLSRRGTVSLAPTDRRRRKERPVLSVAKRLNPRRWPPRAWRPDSARSMRSLSAKYVGRYLARNQASSRRCWRSSLGKRVQPALQRPRLRHPGKDTGLDSRR